MAVSAVAHFGGQKGSCFYSWTLWITTLTLRVRYRPSGSAAIEPEGDQLLNTPKCFPFLSTGGLVKWREPNGRPAEHLLAQRVRCFAPLGPAGVEDRVIDAQGCSLEGRGWGGVQRNSTYSETGVGSQGSPRPWSTLWTRFRPCGPNYHPLNQQKGSSGRVGR